MKKELIVSFEYGVAKNGAHIYFLPELNCILLEWKGDVLLEEWIEILTRGAQEVAKNKATNWIGDTSNLGATSDEHNKWVQEVFTPMVIKAGLKKITVVLPNDILGEMSMQEIMEDLKNTASSSSTMEAMYTKDINEAFAWVKGN
ncbi:MAG TPA: hypothetical protein VIN08_24910 [Ohtaekwangia sp.]|uniref:hypothetical protein n=1 Tax=Ohtaekwangia sp. TaxID=2066019 RepID=UPI002F934130